MRFYHRIALALLFICVFEDNVLGAPNRGRYYWLNCNPDGSDPNCVQNRGPWIDLPGPSQRLPPSGAKDIVPESGEDTPETETEEQSGESSGDLDLFGNPYEKREAWMRDGPQVEEQVVPQVEEPILEEEASGDIDYSNFVFPQRVESKLSEKDLREDNVIQ